MNTTNNREIPPQDKEILLQHLQHIEQLCQAIEKQVHRLEPVLHGSSLTKPLLQELVPAKELMRRLQVSSNTLFRMRKKGLLPYYRIGRRIFYDMNELLREKPKKENGRSRRSLHRGQDGKEEKR